MQLIEIWETFLMQLDTEEGETFVPPAGIVASPVEPANGGGLPASHNSENTDPKTASEAGDSEA